MNSSGDMNTVFSLSLTQRPKRRNKAQQICHTHCAIVVEVIRTAVARAAVGGVEFEQIGYSCNVVLIEVGWT